jgi:hypothetical protein
VSQIRGAKADDNDNDPVEVRHYQILGSGLDDALGRFPTSPIWYRWEVGTGYLFWQYFPNGIIISSPDTCACVLYGPIYNYWDQTGQFDGPLGAPSSDVLRLPSPPAGPGSPPPPPGASYAVFQHGVLYLDPDVRASVEQLSPVTQGMVQSGTGITPTGDGIAQAAQATIQGFADSKLASDQHLSDNVASIRTRTSFNSTGPGGCSGASFNADGRSLLRSHIINVHFDFGLKGCAGTVGDASADLRVELRLFINPPGVTARLVNFSIDAVSSPFSAGNSDIRDALTSALNAQYGRDLLNKTIPKGITVLAGIVETNGDVNLYIAPLCAPTSLLSQDARSSSATLGQLRRLRDDYLVTQPEGRSLIEVTEVFGPALVAALRDERDGPALGEAIAHLLTRTFSERADLDHIAAQLQAVNVDLQRLLSHPTLRSERRWPERLTQRAVGYLRDHLKPDTSFQDAVSHVRSMIHEETERCHRHGGDDRSSG